MGPEVNEREQDKGESSGIHDLYEWKRTAENAVEYDAQYDLMHRIVMPLVTIGVAVGACSWGLWLTNNGHIAWGAALVVVAMYLSFAVAWIEWRRQKARAMHVEKTEKTRE